MSYVDDIYGEIIIERMMIAESTKVYASQYPPQRIVNDAIQSFKERAVEEENKLERVSRDILKTIARTKRMSIKQKQALVRMLVERCVDGYEAKYGY